MQQGQRVLQCVQEVMLQDLCFLWDLIWRLYQHICVVVHSWLHYVFFFYEKTDSVPIWCRRRKDSQKTQVLLLLVQKSVFLTAIKWQRGFHVLPCVSIVTDTIRCGLSLLYRRSLQSGLCSVMAACLMCPWHVIQKRDGVWSVCAWFKLLNLSESRL